MKHINYSCSFGCSIEAALEVIGGKWKGVILYHLSKGTKRFNELQKLMPKVTQRMLTRQLRELERDTVIHREIYAEVPPRVEYSITPFGESLYPILETLESWGNLYLNQLEEIRQQQDVTVYAIVNLGGWR